MPAITRLNDIGIGICPGHPIPIPFTAVITLACTTVLSEGLPAANLNSILMCSCGHTAIPLLVSGLVMAEGAGVHRLGDTGVSTPGGSYVITLAGATVQAGA